MYLRMTPGGLGCTPLPLPADLLSAGRILRRRVGDFVRRWNDDGGILERRLGLGLRLGQQQHKRQ